MHMKVGGGSAPPGTLARGAFIVHLRANINLKCKAMRARGWEGGRDMGGARQHLPREPIQARFT